MRLSWNEVRVRAASFAKEWRDAAYEKGETQSFYNDFFEVFDVRRRSVARYEEHVAKLDNGRGKPGSIGGNPLRRRSPVSVPLSGATWVGGTVAKTGRMRPRPVS